MGSEVVPAVIHLIRRWKIRSTLGHNKTLHQFLDGIATGSTTRTTVPKIGFDSTVAMFLRPKQHFHKACW